MAKEEKKLFDKHLIEIKPYPMKAKLSINLKSLLNS